MSRHRSDTPGLALAYVQVRKQMTDREIVAAATALTVGNVEYVRRLEVLGRPVKLENRGADARMGYFGGGWMTSVGIQMGRNGTKGTIIINLGRGSIRIDPRSAS